MFELNRVRQYLREHPQEAAWPHVSSARQLLMNMFRPPPETERALRFLRAYREDGVRAAWRAFERETGSLLIRCLKRPPASRPRFRKGDPLPARLGRLLDKHYLRLRRNWNAGRIPEETDMVR
jgi:hypothetical protein